MKTLIPVFVLAGFFLLICESNWADSDAGSAPAAGRGHRNAAKLLRSDIGRAKGKGSAKTIRGHCTLVEGGGNPFSGSCVDTVLVLNDAKGSELLRTRTSSTGVFEFAGLDSKEQFSIVSGSKFFEVLSPAVLLNSGEQVELKLRQK